MISINRKKIPIPAIFYSKQIDEARKKLDAYYQTNVISGFRSSYKNLFEPNIRTGILPALRELFNGKCAYCESVINLASSTSQYDHFRPKAGAQGFDKEFSKVHYWWLTYDWNNLYYSCEICNRYKSSWFPVEGPRISPQALSYETLDHVKELLVEKPLLIDPCNDVPEQELVYTFDGKVDYLTVKGRITIEILKLNRIELIAARQHSIDILKERLDKVLTLWENIENNREQLNAELIALLGIFQGDNSEAYLGIQRQFFSKWIKETQGLEAYIAEGKHEWVLKTKRLDFEGAFVQNIVEDINEFNTDLLGDDDRNQIESAINIEGLRHSYIESVELKNFKCFSHFKIDFDSVNTGENERWMLFLGENGVGKTSILKAITLALAGGGYIKTISDALSIDPLKQGESSGYIRIKLKGDDDVIEVTFNQESIESNINTPKANLLAYGAIRLQPKPGKLIAEKTAQKGVKAKNLFDYTVSLVNANAWLLRVRQVDFDRAAEALRKIMMLPDEAVFYRNRQESRVYFIIAGVEFNTNDLSQGYQSVYTLAVDIMSAFATDKITFDVAEGIVLIDEIETHLHPRWKMAVVTQLREAFPKMQFIVTSHEPLCLRGLRKGEVLVLARNEQKEIVGYQDLPDPSELRVDQLLTSEFFGLSSTTDPETEGLFSRYYALLAMDDTERSDAQNDELRRLSSEVPMKSHLGDSLREELVYFVIDELLAKRVRNDGLQIRSEIGAEAVQRVRSIWSEISDSSIGL